MERHYLLNPTWRCPGSCPECWVRRTILLDPKALAEEEHGLDEWVEVFRRDPPATLDIAGGEPFSLPWLPAFIAELRDIRIGLSTNGLYEKHILQLCSRHLDNIISINVSFHPAMMTWYRGYIAQYKRVVSSLHDAGYHVFGSIVQYRDNLTKAMEVRGWFDDNGIPLIVAPYEDMERAAVKQSKTLDCDGGVAHKVFTPSGFVFPCLTSLRSPDRWEYVRGNVFDPSYDPKNECGGRSCQLFCYDYYVLQKDHPGGDMWGVNAREVPLFRTVRRK